MKNNFKKLQKRLNSVPDSLFYKDALSYKETCSQILKSEGWDEEEYMGTIIGLLNSGKVQCGQIVALDVSLSK